MDKLEKTYTSLLSKLEKVREDNESSHILQDRLYRKFVKDIVNGNFASLKDVKKIAKLLNDNVVKYDKDRHYV